jgi:hypothetical protein
MHGTYKISNIEMCDLYLKIVASAPKVQFSLGNELFWFHHKKQLSLWTFWKPYVYSCPFAYNLTSSAIWCQTFNYIFPKILAKVLVTTVFEIFSVSCNLKWCNSHPPKLVVHPILFAMDWTMRRNLVGPAHLRIFSSLDFLLALRHLWRINSLDLLLNSCSCCCNVNYHFCYNIKT